MSLQEEEEEASVFWRLTVKVLEARSLPRTDLCKRLSAGRGLDPREKDQALFGVGPGLPSVYAEVAIGT